MASFDPIDHFDPDAPPPRPTTPPVRRGFLVLLGVLTAAALLVYGIPYVAERAGYAYEAGRSRAASEALKHLDDDGIIGRSSALFRLAVVKVAPAVVNIRSWKAIAPRNPIRGGPQGDPMGRNLVPMGSGSGVVIDKDRGFVVTNHHVVRDADELFVRMGRGTEYPARVVGADEKTDLAVLQVSATLPVQAEWGDSDKLDVGDWVLAIGSPYMLDQTVTAGIVSATRRNNLPSFGDQYQDFVQTDAAVNPGNSGGPLIDLRGRVVGINTAILSPHENGQQGGNIGIGLAISSALARQVVEQLIKNGRVARGYIGVEISGVDRAEAARLGLPSDVRGAEIAGLDRDGPAAAAGLKAGDVIVRVGDAAVDDVPSLRNKVAALGAGAAVPLVYYRDGKKQQATITIGDWPILTALGLRLRDLDGERAEMLPGRPRRAVIIQEVLPNSVAQRAGLLPRLRIVAVGATPVSTKAECQAAAAALDPAAGIPLRIQAPDGSQVSVVLGGPRPGPRRRGE
jgi:serine protease Do